MTDRGVVAGRQVQQLMGTVFSLQLDQPVPAPAVAEMWDWLRHIDAVFSTYRGDSDIARLNAGTRRLADCDPLVPEVLDACAEWQRRTGGSFSATIGGRLDPSGLVKGWAVERASAMLRAAGSHRHFLSGGGDISAVGGPWRIGIADPAHRDRLLDVVALTDAAVATSGTSERGGHVADPMTGRVPSRLRSVSVIAADLVTADVWATALLVRDRLPSDDPVSYTGLDALASSAEGAVEATPGWVSHEHRPAPETTGKTSATR